MLCCVDETNVFARGTVLIGVCQLRDTGAKVLEADFLDEKSITAAAESLKPMGKLDVLINCGGGSSW